MKSRIIAFIFVLIAVASGYYALNSQTPFSYGLDLSGGTRLTYRADVSQLESSDIDGSMDTLRQTIEKRVNIFGVSEPVVTIERGGSFSDDKDENRLSIELPGVTDIESAIKAIGATPLLEFRLEDDMTKGKLNLLSTIASTTSEGTMNRNIYSTYQSSGLTGGQLKRASVVFGNQIGYAQVSLQFNSEAAKLLQKITSENIGREMAIFLDGVLISAPVIQDEIFSGEAQITGNFSAEEAKDLAQSLNFGALPVPIELIETNTIGPSLGQETLQAGTKALMISLVFIAIFLIALYGLPGIVATFALTAYVALMLAIFKFLPVTLTASGIAGFILSIGMAVDANVLIFERIKEEKKKGKKWLEAADEGFRRAWPAIRDGNFTSIIAAVILFWMSGAPVVKGFALVFGIGVIISMLSAVVFTRTLLIAFSKQNKK
jgi:preprotein translocase subunit SecD